MFEKYSVVYSCIISTNLFIQKAACCTIFEDIDTQNEAPSPPYVVQIGGLRFLESSLKRFKTTTLMTLITDPNTALVFLPFSPPLFTNTWLGNCSIMFSSEMLVFRVLEEACCRWGAFRVTFGVMAVWSGGGGTFPVSWELFGPGEITGFVQISAQLFTNCVTLGKFCVFSKSAFSCVWLCIKPLPLPPCFRLWGTRMPFISWHSPTFFALTGFFRFQPEGISFACLSPDPPQRHFCSLSPQTLLSLSPVLVPQSCQKTLSPCLRVRAL